MSYIPTDDAVFWTPDYVPRCYDSRSYLLLGPVWEFGIAFHLRLLYQLDPFLAPVPLNFIIRGEFMNLITESPSGNVSLFLAKTALVIASAAIALQGQVPAGYWTFDDGSGTTAIDSSGNGHTATLVNGVSWVAGDIGSAVSASSASSQNVKIPAIDLSTTKAVTVTFWAKRTYSTSGGHILLEATANYNNSTTGFGFFPDDSDCQGIQASVHGDVGYTAMCYRQPSSAVWHHIAVIYDKSKTGAAEVTLYIDDVLQSPTGYTYISSNTNSFGNNRIYLFSRGGVSEFDSGVLDDLRLYASALSASEIAQIYNFGACKLTANPTSVAFPNTTIGYSTSLSANLVSSCRRTINVSRVTVAGAPFSITGLQPPFSVAPLQTISYTAVFTPTVIGLAPGSITFASDANNPTLPVTLTGTGVSSQQGLLTPSPSSLNFGNVTTNTAQSQIVTITNTGTPSVTVSAVGVVGSEFSLAHISTPFTLASGQSRPLTVTFSPTVNGGATGNLTVTSNAQDGSLTVPLSGTGVTHSVSLAWTASISQISGYNVYRATVSGGPYMKMNTGLVVPTAYTDQSVISGITYYYVTTAVSSTGLESVYSNEARAAVP
jgi:hypothetical protein